MDLGQPSFSRVAAASCEASVLLPARNNAVTIAEALASVLAARDIVLDILILDDASTDDTVAQIRRTLDAAAPHPHGVRVWSGQPRRGLGGNAALTAAAATDLCIVQHGDDISEPERFRKVAGLFAATGADVVSTNFRLLEGTGVVSPRDYDRPEGLVSAEEIVRQGPGPRMVGAALSWRRRVFADFPVLDQRYLFLGHDTLVPFRGALRGGFHHSREPLLRYRLHAGQWSQRLNDERTIEAATENKLFRLLALRQAMASDCRHLRAQPGTDAARLDALLALIATKQTEVLAAFVTHRETMLREGHRPLWIDADLFDRIQLEDYQRHFWRRGFWRRLRAWWRRRRGIKPRWSG